MSSPEQSIPTPDAGNERQSSPEVPQAAETRETVEDSTDRMISESARALDALENAQQDIADKAAEHGGEETPEEQAEGGAIMEEGVKAKRTHDEQISEVAESIPDESSEGEAGAEKAPERSEQDAEREKAKAEKAKKEEEAKLKQQQQEKLRSAGQRWAKAQAQMKKFEGLGVLRTLTGGGKEALANLKEEIEQAKAEYQELRAEMVGEQIETMIAEREQQMKDMVEFAKQEKPFLSKLLDAIPDAVRKTGDMNVTKLGWEPKTKIGRMVGRFMSVRTLINAGLLGAGIAAGGGVGLLAAGAARRALAGAGMYVGSLDTMRMLSEKGAMKFNEEELSSMSAVEASDRMQKIEAQALISGKEFWTIPQYKQLQERLGVAMHSERAEAGVEAESGDALEAKLDAFMRETDDDYEATSKKSARNDKIMKGASLALGAIVGSGLMAKGVRAAGEAMGVFESAPAPTGAVAGAVTEAPPAGVQPEQLASYPSEVPPEQLATIPPEELEGMSVNPAGEVEIVEPTPPPTPVEAFEGKYGQEMLEAARVDRGEGITHVLRDQIKVDPERFGYDPSRHGNLDRWAVRMSARIARENGMLGRLSEMRLSGFDANNPDQYVLLEETPDGEFKVNLQGIEARVFNRPVDLNFGQSGEEWSAHIEYSRNGLPKGFSIDHGEPFSNDRLVDFYQNNDELGNQLANRGNITTLLNTEAGPTYQRWFSAVQREQTLLERLREMGQGNSRAARMIEASVERKIGYINNATGAGELVRFEGADAAQNLADYTESFANKGVDPEGLRQLAYNEYSGITRYEMPNRFGDTLTVDNTEVAREAAMDQLNAIRREISDAAHGNFSYDADTGRVTGFFTTEQGPPILKPAWGQELSHLSGPERMRVLQLSRELAQSDRALRGLSSTLNADSAEYDYLDSLAEQQRQELIRRVGDADIFTDQDTARDVAGRWVEIQADNDAFDQAAMSESAARQSGGLVERPPIAQAEVAPGAVEPQTVVPETSGRAELASRAVEVPGQASEVPPGFQGRFITGPGGEIRGFSPGRMEFLSGDQIDEQMMNEGWRDGKSNLIRGAIENRARNILGRQAALDQLTAAGQGDSAGAEYLRRSIQGIKAATERKYGDVFR